jgi:mono/diheme cytochrome c family protein
MLPPGSRGALTSQPPARCFSMIRTICLACFALLFTAGGLPLRADEPSADQIRFFEEKIRPVIAESCYECHSDKKQQGEVRLDRRDGVFPHLIAPGEPDKSRLLQVLKHDPNDTQMPPKGKLPQDKIDLLTEWVRQGAPWPADTAAAPTASSLPRRENGEIDFDAAAKAHWAYRPISRPVPPAPRSPRPRQHSDRPVCTDSAGGRSAFTRPRSKPGSADSPALC